uniref:Putative LAGLIDADG homing endonuclease n=1 Tax=Oedogonium cardiacum TaxID=55995 RepID=B3V4Q8_OEDCA|nr:putative LAGLIDADG homing endonuclease [Oedogonium cardiacum]YP_002000466.1 putative LAGLIDADG homing endonuclease [Oedogonium cardiacum]ACC97274.1 putative LAGLIDADG homing endonuclease [Oedogonium cardiacum]ACC97302.1 putative LAGLIDADG homing endonuclease [Oedogonium cardiacum]
MPRSNQRNKKSHVSVEIKPLDPVKSSKELIESISDVDIAWMAGLLEGEGSFGLDKRSKQRYEKSTSPPGAYVKISMTDEDVIEKMAKLVNKTYYSPTRLTKKNKKVYILHIGDRESLLALLPRLFPYFGKRRQAEVQVCIDALEDWKKWLAEGGRSKMAKLGAEARNRKLVVPKSNDMVPPNIS